MLCDGPVSPCPLNFSLLFLMARQQLIRSLQFGFFYGFIAPLGGGSWRQQRICLSNVEDHGSQAPRGRGSSKAGLCKGSSIVLGGVALLECLTDRQPGRWLRPILL